MVFILSNYKYIFSNFIFIIFLPSSFAATFNVVLYNGGNPPYSMVTEGKRSGIFIDIFIRISDLTGHNFTFLQLPAARGLREFDLGNVDIEPGINRNWRLSRKEIGIYSIPYASSTEILFGIKNKPIEFFSDLYGSMIGVVRGYSYKKLDEHFGSKKIVKVENKSENELLKQLSRNHLDYICIGDITAQYYQLLNPNYRRYEKIIELGNTQVSLRFHPKNSQYLTEFNQALRYMIINKEIEGIYKKYTL
ncbi:transporter substrate-binding domain-containing protein [Pseudoalteromonas sp. NBT06-2]|uniref:substrate-binding periplasmic protein n=1 Tax=Pseudoalteromonas sp. NBT06-2 TaxID=2025950 RepID=UPI0011410EEF|nr:transporter substrate-binding domain-containing protein [Pseudoalteromonas sp. NBT06-2]